MKNQLTKAVLIVGLTTLGLLMIPLIAMQFTGEVNWTLSDFIIMGALLFITGLAYVLVSRLSSNLVYKLGMAGAVGTTFFMIWANLAVGLIGAGPHLGNFLYIGVIAVAIVGTILSNFQAAGMEKAMYLTSFSLAILAAVALITGMDKYPASSIQEILAVNGFFAFLYLFSGLLFRYVARQSNATR